MPLRKPTKAFKRTSVKDTAPPTTGKRKVTSKGTKGIKRLQSSNKTTVSDSQKYRYTKARKWKT